MADPNSNQSQAPETPAQVPEKPNIISQIIAAVASALAKPIHAIIQWGATAKWKSALVVVALAAAGGTADHYLGPDNAVSQTIKQEQAAPLDPTPSTTTPPADAPLAPPVDEPAPLPTATDSGTAVEPPAPMGE